MKMLSFLIFIPLIAHSTEVANSLNGEIDCSIIINGTETTDYPAIGKLTRTINIDGHTLRVGNCTGTVVAPTKILTAAHCVKEYTDGGGFEWNGKSLSVKDVFVNPEYVKVSKNKSGSKFAYDLAIIEVNDVLADKPIMIDQGLKQGDDVELVGYGFNESIFKPDNSQLTQTGEGVKRKGFNTIDRMENGYATFDGRRENRNFFGFSKVLFDHIDLIDGSDASLAQGDSGGAALKNGKLVGVISGSYSGVGLINADGTYQNFVTPLSSEKNRRFLSKHL